MSEDSIPMHFVCTHEEAKELINKNSRYFVSNCGCREGRGKCDRSSMDVCLNFIEGDSGSGSGIREVDMAKVESILKEAIDKHLVARPFRGGEEMQNIEGICFCCDDCCGYFLDPEEACDKGEYIEKTYLDNCSQCGVCTGVCYFKARNMKDDELHINAENCYGCGLCKEVCPAGCIEMVKR
jgi:Pyruvate/2-oxoacid:ferredoxin oxidoreductase delta subunit